MRLHFLLVISIFAMACDKQEPENDVHNIRIKNSYPGVTEAFWPHFQQFEEEAAIRGQFIDLAGSGIQAAFDTQDTVDQIAGVCNYHPSRPGSILIDTKIWKNTTDLFHELIIFHELGHCSLGRGHLDDAFSSGICKSLMRSGTNGCIDNYRLTTRAAYLDELFE